MWCRFIPESPRWLVSQNNSSRALEITEAMAKENQRKLTKTFEVDPSSSFQMNVLCLSHCLTVSLSHCFTRGFLFQTLSSEEGDSTSASLLDLIRTPNMRKHTFILMFNW